MDYNNIRQLAELVKEMELTKLEITEGDSILKIERQAGLPTIVSAPLHTPVTAVTAVSSDRLPAETAESINLCTVTSPMVGVFYTAPAPDMKPYVSVGDTVKAGDVLCIIEAMKIMNEITAEQDGEIVEVCVKNKQVVDFDHPLFRIRLS